MQDFIKELIGHRPIVINASYYFDVNDTTIRVSNHLPNRCNWENNGNKENKLFIIINENGNLKDWEVEEYLDKEFGIATPYHFFETEEEAIPFVNHILNQL